MKDKTKVIAIIIGLLITLLLGFTCYRCVSKNDIDSKKLSEDIESIIKTGQVKHAKYNQPDELVAGGCSNYIGDGYNICMVIGGDASDFTVTQDGKEIWHYTYIYRQTSE